MLGDVEDIAMLDLASLRRRLPLINTENMLVDLANSSLPTNMASIEKRLSLLNTENASLRTLNDKLKEKEALTDFSWLNASAAPMSSLNPTRK
jgi:ssRNA-specific RNase YbeY (16S rRNA maturation enzyme)